MGRTKIVAEVASNHGGDIRLAKEFIRIAGEVGVDYVKFQSWQLHKLRKDDPQYEWFKLSELTDKTHYELLEECDKRGVKFLTTVFDVDRVEFLSNLGLEEIKVASPDAGSYLLLKILKDKFRHIIVSTGMHYHEEIEKAARVLQGTNFTFFHCVSIYPTPLENVNIKRMEWLKEFTSSVGYSDHTIGTETVKLAIAFGASYVEKHFCLGRFGPGRVMPWDATPEQMGEIVNYSKMVEKLVGSGVPHLSEDEVKSRERFIGRFGNNK